MFGFFKQVGRNALRDGAVAGTSLFIVNQSLKAADNFLNKINGTNEKPDVPKVKDEQKNVDFLSQESNHTPTNR
ncbi:MAG: hypothetical protein P1U74_04200 [Legionellaceae bacterium]|nr:hypothetical protein [Legionellaceae bacterium]